MPTGFTLASYQAALVTQIPSLPADPNFQTILPNAIDYAELSIQRDLDLFATHGILPLGPMTVGTPTLTVDPSVIVMEQLFYTSSAGRLPVTPVSDVALNAIYSTAPNGPPKGWSFLPNTQSTGPSAGIVAQQIEVGPAPDQAYIMTCYGTSRLPTLNESPGGTFISLNMPDLLWAASMIFWSGYNRNFGAQSDDPRQAVSWTSEYARLLKSAGIEEARKKFQSQAWTAHDPAPLAQSPRK